MLERRSFLKGLGLLVAAPAIIKVSQIMPINPRLVPIDAGQTSVVSMWFLLEVENGKLFINGVETLPPPGSSISDNRLLRSWVKAKNVDAEFVMDLFRFDPSYVGTLRPNEDVQIIDIRNFELREKAQHQPLISFDASSPFVAKGYPL